ncbi:hypothetical protein BDQ17DRAFT_1299174 [Cyathus striatus]|nr:hypothetical protein BDQ17DRAFT_1299174 [Cyathus striatus]
MTIVDFLPIVDAILESVGPQELSDNTLLQLRAVFSENLVIAALDLIDRGNIIHYTTPWGHTEYEVLGSTATYSVFLDLGTARIPFYCSCPAFSRIVLAGESAVMCKHVLATRLAKQLSLCTERPSAPDDLADLFCRKMTLPSTFAG